MKYLMFVSIFLPAAGIVARAAPPEAPAAAAPAAVEDVAQATRLLQHLRHRNMKTDAAGHVYYLDVSEQNAVNDETLRAVVHLPHLKEFYAIYTRIHGDGLAHFVGLKHLEKLDLHATYIDDRGFKHIAKMHGLKYLAVQPFYPSKAKPPGHGDITDAGLAEISKLPNLETLRIAGNLTDAGLQVLVGLKKLKTLEVDAPAVTDEGLRRLQAAMPGLEIE